MTTKTYSNTGHLIAGTLLASIGVFCFAIGIHSLLSPSFSYIAWIAAIPAFFFGRLGISHFNSAHKLALKQEQMKQQTEDAETFFSFLKTHEQIKIVLRVDLTTLGPRTRDFRLQVQRALNEYFRELDNLPPNPYQALDKVLEIELRPRADEFGIPNFEVQTIDISVVSAQPAPTKQDPPGVWFNKA